MVFLLFFNIMMSFDELRVKYNFDSNHCFKYLQILNFSRLNQNTALTQPSYSCLENVLIKGSVISEFYNFLTTFSSENSEKRMRAWKVDLQIEISEEQWEMAYASVQNKSLNARFKLIHYKWLM